MFVPQLWLYGLAVVSAGILQAHSRFLAAAAAPLFSSLVVVGAYLLYFRVTAAGASSDLTLLPTEALRVLGWGTTLGVAALALTTLVPLTRLGLRLRPRLRFAAGDTDVIVRIAAAGVAGLVVQQLSLLLISWAAKQTGEPGALTRFSWANAIYLLPYAVLVAPLLQLVFPRLSAAAEQGSDAVGEVLGAIAAPVVVLAGLGAALLAATAVPVARVFVLGPGSGRTEALAWPIVALAPAVLGFALLGLGSRALLAQHLARASGAATVLAWAVVIAAVLVLRSLVPGPWVVTALGAAVSVGMLTGAVAAYAAVRRRPSGASLRLARPLLVTWVAGSAAGGLVGWWSWRLVDVGLGRAVLGAFGCALACALAYALLVLALDRRLLRQVLALRGRPAERSTVGGA
jgi:putative peptidoglycan lipid II flippase